MAATSVPDLLSEPLRGRNAIVTGGAGGIGSAVSAHLAALGANVVIASIGDQTPAQLLATQINGASPNLPPTSRPRAIAVEADVSDEAQVKALFDRAEQEFGPVRILVAAAAVQDATCPYLAETTLQQWELVFNVNAKGTFLCCREAVNRLVRGGGGRIITFSSANVGLVRLGFSAYTSTKAAVEAMTRILAKELGGTGITANVVAPGPIATPMFYAGKSEEQVKGFASESPLGRLGKPEDVASVVGFLAGDGGEWINGQVIRVNGGGFV